MVHRGRGRLPQLPPLSSRAAVVASPLRLARTSSVVALGLVGGGGGGGGVRHPPGCRQPSANPAMHASGKTFALVTPPSLCGDSDTIHVVLGPCEKHFNAGPRGEQSVPVLLHVSSSTRTQAKEHPRLWTRAAVNATYVNVHRRGTTRWYGTAFCCRSSRALQWG